MIQKVKNFNEKKNINEKQMPISARLMDIQSEFGELSKEYLKATSYGDFEFFVTEDFVLEFGDVMYSLISLGLESCIDIEKSVDDVIAKYQKRINENKNMGSGR